MQDYHYVWLVAHPHRTENWLRDRLRDGFDIHHVDGNKANNIAANLALIEHTDHMALHGGRTLGRLSGGKYPRQRKIRLPDGSYACLMPHKHRKRLLIEWIAVENMRERSIRC